MPQTAQAQRESSVGFQTNSTAFIQRLPTEIIAHIFILGCPRPDHARHRIDAAPLHHQVLVGSICQRWRSIASSSPALWTSVVVRYPYRERDLKFCTKMINLMFQRSGKLELDLSVDIFYYRTHFPSAHPCYELIVPHLQRVHTLDVHCGPHFQSLLPISNLPELVNLRHYYAKQGAGLVAKSKLAFPPCARNSPLESFHYDFRGSLDLSTIPSSLHTLSMKMPGRGRYLELDVTKFIKERNFLALTLYGPYWCPVCLAVSSPTLTFLSLDIKMSRQSLASLVGQLPNLLHLCFRVRYIRVPGEQQLCHPLPSLRSLNFRVIDGRPHPPEPYITGVLRGAPQLVALQIWDVDTFEVVVEFYRTHNEEESDKGIKRHPLRLLLLMVDNYNDLAKWNELHSILRSRSPRLQTEWYTDLRNQELDDDPGLIRINNACVELSPPLRVRADQILQEV